MMNELYEDGWDSSQDQNINTDLNTQPIRYQCQKGLNILQAKHHSLQPDMISGWKPKLPSCPLPLSYPNQYVDSLIGYLAKNDSYYSVVYVGSRYVNSVQINQKYSYFWRYRQRYSLNLAIIQDAIRKVGNEQTSKIQIVHGNHKFDSSFESGNLDLVVKVKKNQYDCFLRSDTNTKGHTNWFYFKIENNSQVGPIKINICNMTKTRNLYSKGMKPYCKVGENGIWSQQHCYQTVFVQRYCRYGFDKKTYQLQFCYNFKQPNQTIYIAYSIPYTYSDLQTFIKQIKQSHPSILSSKKLCESLGGLDIPLLTITNPDNNSQQIQNSPNNQNQQNQIKKKVIIIAGRIHPGESNTSHMMEGFIRQLLRDIQLSNILRKMFVFHIVPMLNPDGVIAGNFRTSYSGKDLNRQFNKLDKYIFPQITSLSQFCQSLKKSQNRGVQFYFDFHGHSAKKNLFCYGPEHPTSKTYYFKSRALAKIIQKMSSIFSYRKSIFTISEQKKHTARAYMLRNLKIPMTFTFEISNGIYENQDKKDILLDRNIILNAGQIILNGLYRYAQLQMRIPKKYIKAKVDTGFVKHRKLNSAGSNRRGDAMKKRLLQKSGQFREGKGKSVEKLRSTQKVKEEDNKQFIALLKQIKKQESDMLERLVQIEGGSDSESEGEDFTKQQSNNLFLQILHRNQQSRSNRGGYIIREKKKLKNLKLVHKKKQNEQDQIDNALKDHTLIQSKKFKSTRIIQLSKPPITSIKNIKRGMSMEYQKIVLAQKNFTLLL